MIQSTSALGRCKRPAARFTCGMSCNPIPIPGAALAPQESEVQP